MGLVVVRACGGAWVSKRLRVCWVEDLSCLRDAACGLNLFYQEAQQPQQMGWGYSRAKCSRVSVPFAPTAFAAGQAGG